MRKGSTTTGAMLLAFSGAVVLCGGGVAHAQTVQLSQQDTTYEDWMRAMQSVKQQQEEREAQQRAQREQIERDNERYREMRDAEDRRWMEQNQRAQRSSQASTYGQPVPSGPCPDATQVRLATGVCYGDGRKLDSSIPPSAREPTQPRYQGGGSNRPGQK